LTLRFSRKEESRRIVETVGNLATAKQEEGYPRVVGTVGSIPQRCVLWDGFHSFHNPVSIHNWR
jgi:hypothetical protein